MGGAGGVANALSDTNSSDKNTGKPRGGNIFGTENYDMPREQMESSVEGLKPGWSEILPQIGGVLKSMGFDPVLTSAARTREHQMRINPSAPNSYHVIQDGGDAIIDSRARAASFGLLQIDGQAPSAKTGDDSQTQPSQTRQDFDLNTQDLLTKDFPKPSKKKISTP